MINTLLVANRGEIARRVFATCRRLGIRTVAVHSDADAGLPYVAEADFAVRLPGTSPAETYLDIDLLLDAARRTGADAIHPGYGFLSESAAFARAVLDAGLTWVGPAPESITVMADKVEAKRRMSEAGVPVLTAPADPTEADLPLLVKASAGGGGRGMRIVRDLGSLDQEIADARDEAASAFGDGTVFVEPYVEASRHVEVQVVGFPQGVLVLGERDCSVQRRHQKVLEESPAPLLPESTREALRAAATAAAVAIDYQGAGTVEFLYDPSRPDAEAFFFLEMNTRLQVEHPVTECVYGLDLVELQLAVAEGATSPPVVAEPTGHAVEVRLYAEDPSADYAPQSGRLVTVDVPHDVAFAPLRRAGIRVDAGFTSGDEVSIHYDAMLAKVISWAPSRGQALRQLAGALQRARIHGLGTNRAQLLAILADDEVSAGTMTTGLLDNPSLSGARSTDPWTVVAAALMLAADDARRRTVQRGIPPGWRNVLSQPQRTLVQVDGEETSVDWWGTRDGFVVDGAEVLEVNTDRVRLEIDGVQRSYRGVLSEHQSAARVVYVDGPSSPNGSGPGVSSVAVREVPRFRIPERDHPTGSLLAPMPGTVISVAVHGGEPVEDGQTVLVLEAMKMQHQVRAPHAGVIAEISVAPGAHVAAGEVLAVVSSGASEAESTSEEKKGTDEQLH